MREGDGVAVAKKLPKNVVLTLEHQALRICARFGQRPSWWNTLSRHDQVTLIAFEEIERDIETGNVETD